MESNIKDRIGLILYKTDALTTNQTENRKTPKAFPWGKVPQCAHWGG